MTYCHYERLSAMDALFLDLEDQNSHMHIGSVALFAAKPLHNAAGGVDIERVSRHLEATLLHHPRFRQRLAYVPGLGRPVWIDDTTFNLHYHVRHTCLPAPGDERLLKRLAGRVMSQQLDRGKPLWELWLVEGVAGDRFAVITKLHHCLADGLSGVDLAASMLSLEPDTTHDRPRSWIPRPAPSRARLLADELRRRATAPLALVGRSGGSIGDLAGDVKDAALGLVETFDGGAGPASETPFDTDLGPHRRFDWVRMDLDDVKLVRDRLCGTLNDVVLAVAAGALRRFLRDRGMAVESLTFRVMVPVNVRRPNQRGTLGNRVAMMMVRLPLGERDPVERLRAICSETTERKGGHQSAAAQLFARVADAILPELTGPLARLGLRSHPANLVITNVPGPSMPVYLLGARQLEAYPVVPLATGQALGIALLTYAGGLHWGFNSDWDALPDLHDLAEGTVAEFGRLVAAAREARAPGGAAPAPKRAGRGKARSTASPVAKSTGRTKTRPKLKRGR
jgi:WS/DGAT/MGAT family acyltransferase